MKLIKLHAYLQNNVGDDLMVELLVDRYPEYYFWSCRGQQKKTQKLRISKRFFDNEDVYGIWGRLNHLCNLITGKKDLVYKIVFRSLNEKSMCGVTIGGSIYRELKDQTLEERMAYEENKKAPGAPYYVIGANFGPFSSSGFLWSFTSFFSSCDGVSFRDRDSYELFHGLQSVQWAPDVVFNVPEGNVCDGHKVVLSVINLENRNQLKEYDSLYIQKMAALCEYWTEKGKIPVLVSFCSYEGDKECIEKIYSLLSEPCKEKTEMFFYNGNTEEVLELFRKAHFVVATRFHAMILALRFRKPLFTITYELKMDNVLKDTHSTAFSSIEHLSAYTPELIYQLGKVPIDIDGYMQNADRQFAQLDGFLLDANR